jgi:hypothetical protein
MDGGGGGAKYGFSGKIPQMEEEVQLRKYFDHQVKCSSLMIDRDETYMVCREGRTQGAKCGV